MHRKPAHIVALPLWRRTDQAAVPTDAPQGAAAIVGPSPAKPSLQQGCRIDSCRNMRRQGCGRFWIASRGIAGLLFMPGESGCAPEAIMSSAEQGRHPICSDCGSPPTSRSRSRRLFAAIAGAKQVRTGKEKGIRSSSPHGVSGTMGSRSTWIGPPTSIKRCGRWICGFS